MSLETHVPFEVKYTFGNILVLTKIVVRQMSTTNENLTFEIMLFHTLFSPFLFNKYVHKNDQKEYNDKLRLPIYMLNICITNINQNGKVLLDNCETSIFNCGNKNTENCVLLFRFSNNNDLLIIGGTEEFQFSFITRAELK